jgi:hypothetical protein
LTSTTLVSICVAALATTSAAQVGLGWGIAPHRSTSPAREPRHVALLIGIADYKALGDRPDVINGLTDLSGPINDVQRMRASLLQWGFTDSSDVKVLTNSEASRDAMLHAFQWVGERATDSSDVVLVFFSGHGTRVTPASAAASGGYDQALVPYDAANFRMASQVVVGHSLGVSLRALKTHNVTVVIDACFSGAMTRGLPAGHMKGLQGTMDTRVHDGLFDEGTSGLGHTVISASRTFEPAQELDFPRNSGEHWNGALTYHLTRLLDGASAERGMRYDDLMGALRLAVAGERVAQIPQIHGDSVSPLFRSHTGLASRAFVLVSRQSGGEVGIGAGVIHGVRPSAIYDVFGAAESRFAGGRLARVRIDAVADATSRGTIVGESGDPLPVAPRLPLGARAVAALVPLGGTEVPRLRVFVAASARTDVARATATFDTGHIEIVRDSTRAHAIVTRSRGVLEVIADGATLPPQIYPGQPLPPFVTVQRDTIMGYTDATLCGALTRAFSIAKLAELRNPASPAGLRAYMRVVPSGAKPPFDTLTLADTAAIGTAADTSRVDIYAYVSVPKQAVAKTRLYLSAAVAGFASDPDSLWPPTRQEPERFPLNSWKAIGTAIPLTPPAGREVITFTVNSDQYNLHSLISSARLCRGDARMAQNKRTPEAAADSVAGWTTASRVLQILPSRRK